MLRKKTWQLYKFCTRILYTYLKSAIVWVHFIETTLQVWGTTLSIEKKNLNCPKGHMHALQYCNMLSGRRYLQLSKAGMYEKEQRLRQENKLQINKTSQLQAEMPSFHGKYSDNQLNANLHFSFQWQPPDQRRVHLQTAISILHVDLLCFSNRAENSP